MTEPNATIVHKLPKQIVPDEYLKLVLNENKVGFGFAGQEAGNKIVIENTRGIMLKEIMELQNSFKDNHLVMYFSNGGVVPDDVMPYTVSNGKMDDDIEHFMAMFYEGDFDKYAGMDGEHAGVYCVFDAEVAPKIGQLFSESGKDWTKTFEAMRGDKWQRILGNYFNNRGVFVILTPTGDPISFGKNELGGQFPWGNVSNRHGYTGKPAEAPVTEADNGGLSFLRGKAKALLGSVTPAAPAAPVTPTPTPEPVPEKPPSENKPDVVHVTRKDKEDIETKVVDGVTLTKMRPPPSVRGNKKANNAWLRMFNKGKLDEETQRNQFVWVAADLVPYAQRLVTSKDQIEKMAVEINKLKAPSVIKANETAATAAEILSGKEKPITAGKSTVRETVAEAAAASAAAKSPADFLPVLDDNQREKALAKMAAFTSKGKQLTGLELQKMEARWPTFSEDIGVDFEKDLMPRPIDDLVELFDGNKIAACAYIEMRHEVHRLRSLCETGKIDYTKPAKDVKPEVKPEPVQVKDDGGLSFLRGKSAA